MIIDKIKQFFRSVDKMHVVLDPADSSVTLSKALFAHIKEGAKDDDMAKFFVFSVAGDTAGKVYGFKVNPDIDRPTQLCNIQYNSKYKCVGFETLCPTVSSILYNYDLSATKAVRLSVSVREANGVAYYQIERHNGKHLR